MGSSQSKVSADAGLQEKALLSRLYAMRLESKSRDDGYVFVDDYTADTEEPIQEKPDGGSWLTREPENLSVDEVQGWQSSLLEDPKNRSVAGSRPPMPC